MQVKRRILKAIQEKPQMEADLADNLPYSPDVLERHLEHLRKQDHIDRIFMICEEPYLVPATESIIPLLFNELRRVSASEDWPFFAEI